MAPARLGSITIEGAAAYRRGIAVVEDSQVQQAELEAHYHQLGSPLRTAERFGILDVIDPREMRAILCDWVEDAYELLYANRPTNRPG